MTTNVSDAIARAGQLAAVLFVLTSASACSLLGGGRSPDALATGPTERLVALDFTNALSQLDGYRPGETIVRLDEATADDTFLEAMRNALRERGYAVRAVTNGDGDAGLLRYRRERGAPSDGVVTADAARLDVYEIAFGSIRMRREYDVGASGRIAPASPLYVRGADASGIRLDESIFESGAPAVPAATPRERSGGADGTLAASDEAPRGPAPKAIGTNTPVATAGVRRERPRPGRALPGELVPRSDYPGNGSLAALTGGDVNMFELGTSNFDDVFTAYEDIEEAILVFADDSLNLGKRNKRVVEALVARYEPDSDLFSVVGCSLGPTRISGGNAALALGRAGRVREALLFSGVEQQAILDEGCWAGEGTRGELPTRGVVVTLKRRRG